MLKAVKGSCHENYYYICLSLFYSFAKLNLLQIFLNAHLAAILNALREGHMDSLRTEV